MAAWLNAACDVDHVAVAGMLRVSAEKELQRQTVADLGIRGIYKGKKFAASVELLGRYRFDVDDKASTYKADVAVEYEITDGTWLSVSIGKDFAFQPGDIGSLFTLANLQWNVGEPQLGK